MVKALVTIIVIYFGIMLNPYVSAMHGKQHQAPEKHSSTSVALSLHDGCYMMIVKTKPSSSGEVSEWSKECR